MFKWSNLFSETPHRSAWMVELVTRQGCHLCEDALLWLNHQQKKEGFTLKVLDIHDHPQYREKYDQCVPVVMINGKVRFRGRINVSLWNRLRD